MRRFLLCYFYAFPLRPDHVLSNHSQGRPRTLWKKYSLRVIHGTTTHWARLAEKFLSTCHAGAYVAAWQKTSFHCLQTCHATKLSRSCCTSCQINLHIFIGTRHTSQACCAPAPSPSAMACLLQLSCISPLSCLHLGAPGGACLRSFHILIGNHSIP